MIFFQSVGLDDIIADHLHEMLVESKPEWDTNNDYDYEKIDEDLEDLSNNEVVKEEKEEVEENDDTLENDLFDLIDSMYDNREDGE